jgi:hypothetical protein
MVSHKRKYCTNNKSKKLLTIMNTKLDLIQKSLDDLHKEHADASTSPTGLTDSSATLDSDSNASMYQSDLNESPMSESPAPADVSTETEMSDNNTMPSTEEDYGTPIASQTEEPETPMASQTEEPETPMASQTEEPETPMASQTEASSTGSLSPIVAPAPGTSGSEESTPSWMNESPKDYGERQPETPPGGYPPASSEESKTGGRRRIRKSKRQQRQYLRNKSRNRRM